MWDPSRIRLRIFAVRLGVRCHPSHRSPAGSRDSVLCGHISARGGRRLGKRGWEIHDTLACRAIKSVMGSVTDLGLEMSQDEMSDRIPRAMTGKWKTASDILAGRLLPSR